MKVSEEIMNRRYAAVVVNDLGQILPYTVQGTAEQCNEHAISFWGEETWNKLQELGCKIHTCSIIIED